MSHPLGFQKHESELRFSFEHELERLASERERHFATIAPKHKKPLVCVHWLRGLCHRNEITCDALHVYEPSLFPVCHFFNKEEGRCNNPDCVFRHPTTKDGDIICVAYARGFCERGEKCSDRHVKRKAEDLEHRAQFIRDAQDSHRRAEERARQYQRQTTQSIDRRSSRGRGGVAPKRKRYAGTARSASTSRGRNR